jgi:nicotinamidase-related amidase
MPLIAPARAQLLLIDFQERLMPAIAEGAAVVANAQRLAEAAALLSVPALRTEQYPKGLGGTVAALAGFGAAVEKTHFGSCAAPGFVDALKGDHLIVAGCETHVCVLQTVFGLLAAGRSVFVVADACGSRTAENKRVALERMARAGAEIVTTEMVVFEWLENASHPKFKDVSRLIK